MASKIYTIVDMMQVLEWSDCNEMLMNSNCRLICVCETQVCMRNSVQHCFIMCDLHIWSLTSKHIIMPPSPLNLTRSRPSQQYPWCRFGQNRITPCWEMMSPRHCHIYKSVVERTATLYIKVSVLVIVDSVLLEDDDEEDDVGDADYDAQPGGHCVHVQMEVPHVDRSRPAHGYHSGLYSWGGKHNIGLSIDGEPSRTACLLLRR